MDQMNFLGDLQSQLTSAFDKYVLSNEEVVSNSTDTQEDACSGNFFRKIKYVSTNAVTKTFTDWYDSDLLVINNNVILMEISIKQDSSKTISARSSTEVLDFLGDIGGFKEAIMIIMVTFGEYFSAKFFVSTVANDMYMQKEDQPKKKSNEYEGGQ